MLGLVNYEGEEVLSTNKDAFVLGNLHVAVCDVVEAYADDFEYYADDDADYKYVAYDGFQF